MRRPQIIITGGFFGIVAGLLIGLFFKWIESMELANVYTLLLNIDFIPFLPPQLDEWQEFSLHLLVSAMMGLLFGWLLQWSGRPWLSGMLVGLIPLPLFIPLTLISERTPAIDDFYALLWWIVGHLGYGACLSLLGKRVTIQRRSWHFP
jgi:hypothetical protein